MKYLKLTLLFIFIICLLFSSIANSASWPGECTLMFWEQDPYVYTITNGYVAHVDYVSISSIGYPNYGTAHNHYATPTNPQYFSWLYVETWYWDGTSWVRPCPNCINSLKSEPGQQYVGDTTTYTIHVPWSEWATRTSYFPEGCGMLCENEYIAKILECGGADKIAEWNPVSCQGTCLIAPPEREQNLGPCM